MAEPKVKSELEARVLDTGDTMTGLLNAHGGISLNSSTKSGDLSYILGIKAFADGGNILWANKDIVEVGKANALTPGAELVIGNVSKTFTGENNLTFSHYQMGVARCNFHGTDMNDVATYGNGMGMVRISTNTGSSIVNPNNQSSWHHYINLSWSDCLDYNNNESNYWITQIANACGSTDLYVRSRNGGALDDTTAWVAPWTKILTENNVSSVLDDIYVNISGDTLTGTLIGKKGSKYGFQIGAANITCESTTNGEIVLQGGFLRFGPDTWDYSAWAGLKYDFSTKIIYLGVADGTIFTKNSSIITGGTVQLVNCGLLLGSGYQIKRVGQSSSWYNGRNTALIRLTSYTGYNAILSCKTTNGSWELGPYTNDILYFVYNTDTGYNSGANTSGQYFNSINLRPTGVLYGAAWNDYAEYRDQETSIQPGYCAISQRNGKLLLTSERLSPCDGVVSDTFGFAIGETEECQTPLAASGRVLVYVDGNREDYEIGDCICAGPKGLGYKMTREEIKEYPDRIVGTVSEIPEYKTWGTGNVEVNGRIWIKVR